MLYGNSGTPPELYGVDVVEVVDWVVVAVVVVVVEDAVVVVVVVVEDEEGPALKTTTVPVIVGWMAQW